VFPTFIILAATIGLPDGQYFTTNLAEASKKLVFSKQVLEAGIFKIHNLQ